jgi:hypothetical protein
MKYIHYTTYIKVLPPFENVECLEKLSHFGKEVITFFVRKCSVIKYLTNFSFVKVLVKLGQHKSYIITENNGEFDSPIPLFGPFEGYP